MTITATPWGTIAELPGVLAQPLTPEQAALVERNHNLVRWYYKRCIGRLKNLPCLDAEELFSMLQRRLIRAAQGYKPERGAFSTYAVNGFHLGFNDFVRRLKRQQKRSPKQLSLDWHGSHTAPFSSMLASKVYEDAAIARDNQESTIEMWRKVSRFVGDKNAMLLWDRYARGMSLNAIGEALGLSKEGVRQKLLTLEKRLARYLTKE